MKTMRSVLFNKKGGAILAVLVIIPAITIGGIAAYKMTNQTIDISFQAAAEENAYFVVEGATEQVLAIIINDINSGGTMMPAIKTASPNADLTAILGIQNPQPYPLQQSRYKGLTARYIVTKGTPLADIPHPLTSIAINIEARLYNGTPGTWGKDDGNIASKKTYQEFDGGAIQPGGCAANYDFFAGHDYNSAGVFTFFGVSTAAHYAGNEWRTCPVLSMFTFSNECVDQPSTGIGINGSYKLPLGIGFGCKNKCGDPGITCDFTPALSFGDAIGTPGTDAINLNGNVGDYQDSHEYSVLSNISEDASSATSHQAAEDAMKADPKVSNIGSWYFRDTNNNNLPDIDSPYFYHDGDSTAALPMEISMFRFREVFLYVDGFIKDLSFFKASGFNGSQLTIIASGDIQSFSMMNTELDSAGLMCISGGDFTNAEMMEMSGFSNTTLLSNNDINLSTGFDFTFAKRMRLIAANDINITAGFKIGGTHGQGGECGCVGAPDEPADYAIGRRFNG